MKLDLLKKKRSQTIILSESLLINIIIIFIGKFIAMSIETSMETHKVLCCVKVLD